MIVQTAAYHASSIYGGRFITGLGVGSLSMAVPLYNGELSPPEVRGSLVALQQMAITTGIMVRPSKFGLETPLTSHGIVIGIFLDRLRHQLHRRNWTIAKPSSLEDSIGTAAQYVSAADS